MGLDVLYAKLYQFRSYNLWYLVKVNRPDPIKLMHSKHGNYYYMHAGYTVDRDRQHLLQNHSFDLLDAVNLHTTFQQQDVYDHQSRKNDSVLTKVMTQFALMQFVYVRPTLGGSF
ncbi:hypothetical protein D3C76_1287530 [compost metagenome]